MRVFYSLDAKFQFTAVAPMLFNTSLASYLLQLLPVLVNASVKR